MTNRSRTASWPPARNPAERSENGLTLLEAYALLARQACRDSGMEAPPAGNLAFGDSGLLLWNRVVSRQETS